MAKFDVTNATEEQKEAFIQGCIAAYNETIKQPTEATGVIVWKTFQIYLQNKLAIPKSRFKATHWKPILKAEEEKKAGQLVIRWRT